MRLPRAWGPPPELQGSPASLRRPHLFSAIVVVLTLAGAPACAGQARGADDRGRDAALALRAGEYDRAIALYAALAAAPGAPPAERRAYVGTLLEVGRLDDAERAARAWADGDAAGLATLGDVLAARGRRADAAAAYERALAARTADSLPARLGLATMRWERGERDAVWADLERVAAPWLRDARLSRDDALAAGEALRRLGARDSKRFKEALAALDDAAALDTLALEPRVRLGELFLEKYNSGDAAQELARVLAVNPRHPRALVAEARRRRFDGQPGAMELVRRALAAAPALAEAHTMLGTLHLDAEDYAEAEAEAERALAARADDGQALAVLAAARWMRGDRAGYEDVRRRALAADPRGAGFFATLAELSARNRLYRQAVELAREGTRLDPVAWRAHALLGVNLLRTGDVPGARASLERAFAGDPFDPWTKNTLDLLDTYGAYREVKTGRYVFMIDSAEADLLAPYLTRVADEAYAALAARYGYEPPPPIRVELFRRHADFSVRTVGLAGLGALGVSFGTTVAMDSPGARDAGTFNWGSTFWHELAHTFTLGASDNRVPRWLSEGLSVLEERRARPGWGADVSLPFLAALGAGRLKPVSRLNDGFMRPEYPEQLFFSYYQASLVCEWIEETRGAPAVVAMLRGYRDGLGTGQVMQRVLGMDEKTVDARFDAWMRARLASRLAAVAGASRAEPDDDALAARADAAQGDFLAQLARGRTLAAAGRNDEALPYLERATRLFPEHAARDGAWWTLARVHRARGDARRAAEALARQAALDESDRAANVELAALLDSLGDAAGAAKALERALWISPYDIEIHQRLAALAARTGDRALAVRERRAVVALRPVDRADALYQLARAHFEAGEIAAARREVLRALELAPNFEAAQELLLTLQRAGESAGAGGG